MSAHSSNTSTTAPASSAPGSTGDIIARPNSALSFSDWDGGETSSQRGRPESVNSNPNGRHSHLQGYSPARGRAPPDYSANSDPPFAFHSRAPSYNTTQQEAATAGARDFPRQSFVGMSGRPIEGLKVTMVIRKQEGHLQYHKKNRKNSQFFVLLLSCTRLLPMRPGWTTFTMRQGDVILPNNELCISLERKDPPL